MKKTLFALAVLCAALLEISFASAAPAPWGLAINTETKECAGFWPGDEFVAYKLPEGWKAYYPKYDQSSQNHSGKIQTEIGECSFEIRKEEACCAELGYTFVSDNIGKDQKTILRDREEFQNKLRQKNRSSAYAVPAVILLLAIAVIFVLIKYIKKNRKQTL